MIRPYPNLTPALLPFLLCLAAPALAQASAAGQIKTSAGTVTIERGALRLPGAIGSEVQASDKVRTGADGTVGITLKDNTLLSAGPNSLLVLDRFAFDTTTYQGGMTATLKKGTLAVATGKLAKQAPESVEFRTPTSIIGVRGTEFAVEVQGGEE